MPAERLHTARFLEGGIMGTAIRAHDWEGTSLGAPDGWSTVLQLTTSLLLNSGQPMFVAYGPGHILVYNDAYIPLLGPKHPRALGRPFFDVWPEVQSEIEPLFRRVLAGERIDMDDIALVLDRGGLLKAHFAFSYTPLRDDHWNIAGVFCVCRETTDTVRARELSERHTARLARMFERAPSFIALLEGPEHRIVLANPAYQKLVGKRPLLGLTIAQALPDAVEQGYLQILDTVYRTNEPYFSTGAKYAVRPSLGGETSERYVDFVYQPLSDSTGGVTGIFVEGTDVTERVRADEALRMSELHLREANTALESRIHERTSQLLAREALIHTFYEHSSECHAVLGTDGSGTFIYREINPATLKLYGKTREQVIDHTLDEVLVPKAAEELRLNLQACLNSNAPYRYERVQGEGIVEAVATLVPYEFGTERRIIVSAREVTERRRLEQQLLQSQKMEAVGQLTGGLAHDFNNLLTGIIGSLELVQNRVAQGRIQDLDSYLAAGQGAARRAAALTHRLLAFSRRQTLDPRPVDANRLITDLVDLIRRTVGPQIMVEVVGAVGLWTTRVDPNQLENALLNLCINARDAMPNGGKITMETANRWIDARTSIVRELPEGQYISVCVSDTGSGMSPDVLARAFDPFFTTKPLGEGTGLGLSMIYGFARQSGGQVRLYSEPSRGTNACIFLPRWLGGEAQTEDSSPVKAGLPEGQGETVLVVDDEPTIRLLVGEVLQDLGLQGIECSDGISALKILESDRRIDLLVTDVGLPNGINGRQLADAARVLRPELKVLFITGYAENAVFGHGVLPTGFAVLTKPFEMDMLAKRMLSVMKKTGDGKTASMPTLDDSGRPIPNS
jgi:PAS domain S-box-containing protein